jgi:hypothetical protein
MLVLSTLVLGYALQINNGFYAPAAIALLIVAILLAVLAFAGACWKPRVHLSSEDTSLETLVVSKSLAARALIPILIGGLALNLVLLALMPPGLYVRSPTPDRPLFLFALGCAGALIVLIVVDRSRTRLLWFPLLLVTATFLGLWMLRASPHPQIDVVTVHDFAIAAMRQGKNPYAIVFPNIYRDANLYAPGMVVDGKVLFGLPYPPLSLFMALPGKVLANDIRFAELASLIAGAALLGYAPRAQDAGSFLGPLAAALLLFTPRGLFVLEQGWTEHFAIGWLGASMFAACRAPRVLPWVLAGLIGVKQHLALVVPLALLMAPHPVRLHSSKRLLLIIVVTPLLLALPFLIWDSEAFLHSVVWLQLREPFRPDSLSLPSALAANGWTIDRSSALIFVLPLAALTIGLVVAWRCAPRTPAGFAAVLGFTLLLAFAGSKKAFCNYYFFVIAAFCAAIAANDHGRTRPADS